MTHITQRALGTLAARKRGIWPGTVAVANACDQGGSDDADDVLAGDMAIAIEDGAEVEVLARVTCPACRIRIDAALEGQVIPPSEAREPA